MADRVISWDHGEAEVQLLGGMLGPVRFRLENDVIVQPFSVAPWGDDSGPEHDALPGLMKRLRGEWPCVPFGSPCVPEGLPVSWLPTKANPVGSDFHGYGSNNLWRVLEDSQSSILIESNYPEHHPIRRLRRRITGRTGEPCLDIYLTIEVRSAIETPIALHPVFRLPETPGSARIDLGDYDLGRVLPFPVLPGKSRLVPDTVFETIQQIPAYPHPVSLVRLPLAFDTEELVQICGSSGQVTLTNEMEEYQVYIHFDAEAFPSVVIWLSNAGRTTYPWNGRFVALGVEPVRAAFDLGADVGGYAKNPIASAGYPTALAIRPDAPFATRYAIGVSSHQISTV